MEPLLFDLSILSIFPSRSVTIIEGMIFSSRSAVVAPSAAIKV